MRKESEQRRNAKRETEGAAARDRILRRGIKSCQVQSFLRDDPATGVQ